MFEISDDTVVEVQRPGGDVREVQWGVYRDALTYAGLRSALEGDLSAYGFTMAHGDTIRLSWNELKSARSQLASLRPRSRRNSRRRSSRKR